MRRLLVILAAGLLATSAFAELTALSEAEIHTALIGNTLRGYDDDGVYVEYLDPNGTVAGESEDGAYSGTWEIKWGMLCLSFPDPADYGDTTDSAVDDDDPDGCWTIVLHDTVVLFRASAHGGGPLYEAELLNGQHGL